MKLLDWAVRLATLALSLLATMAIIASLVSVSHQPGGIAGTMAERAPPPPAPPPQPAPAPVPAQAPLQADDTPVAALPDAGDLPASRAAMASSAAEASGVRWLEALTYAVLALAGFAAAILFVLLRIAGQLGRLADRA